MEVVDVEPSSNHDSDSENLLRPGDEISTNSQFRLRRAFKNAATLFDEQLQWFQVCQPEIQQHSDSQGTEHRITLHVPTPPEDWSLQLGEILNHLSSAKDNLFTEIVRKYSGYSDSKIRKHLGSTYWPVCRSLTDWEEVVKKYYFIPGWLLSRIETFQPFRDRPDPNTSPDASWMSMGASTWARNVNNSDKHSQPVEVSLNHFLNEPLGLEGTLAEPVRVDQRFDHTDPLAKKPMVQIVSAPSPGIHLTVNSVGILLMVRKNPKSLWAPLNQSMWHVLVENQVVLNTVYFGRKAARKRIIPWSHDDGLILSDAIYSWSKDGKRRLKLRRNLIFDTIQGAYV